MSRKIIGVTVGTPLSTAKIEEKLKPVKTINGEAPDENGNVKLPDYAEKSDVPKALSDMTEDTSHRTVTDAEKQTWNAKSNFSGKYADLSGKPTIPSAYTHPDEHPASMISGLATVATSGKYSDLSGRPTIPTVPSALKNPNALTFTGAASGSYDGSEAKTVNIPTVPSALKNPKALTIDGQSYDGSKAVNVTLPTVPSALKNPQKLIFAGAASGEYDGSSEVTIEIPTGGSESETETVLSDNLFDKSKITRDKIFYHGTSNISLVDNPDSFYAYVPLRGAGTYYTVLRVALWGETIAKKVPICKEDNTFLQFATGTLTPIDSANSYLEFTVTDGMVANGAAVYAFSGTTNESYSYNHNTVMIVKDRDYPSEYIRYGYIEVPTSNAKKKSNPLCGKVAVFLGDSICAATTVEGEYYNYGWAGMIGEANQMSWTNYGKNGGTIAHRGSDSTCIANIADKAITEHPAADYVIFEGGCNDADIMREAGLGSISSDYATFDTTTFTGAFEALVLKLITAYPYAKIGYIIPPKMYARNDYTANTHLHRLYFNRAIEVCEKWGIAVIDLWRGSSLNPKLANSSLFYTDGQHLTLAGYEKIVPMIEAWMGDLYSVGSVPSVVSGNTGGGSASIDVTAEVGQTIRVKEVDANGKPTKWEAAPYQPRTHWEEETLLFSGTFDAESLQYGVAVDFTLTDGETYKVMWNGVEYSCLARYMPSDNGEKFLVLGNVDLALGTGDTGEPFLLIVLAGVLVDFAISEYTSVELSITGQKVNVIPSKYLKNALPHYVELVDGDGTGNFVTMETPENLIAQYNSGRAIFAKLIVSGGNMLLPLFQLNTVSGSAMFGIQIKYDQYAYVGLTATDGVYSVAATFSG